MAATHAHQCADYGLAASPAAIAAVARVEAAAAYLRSRIYARLIFGRPDNAATDAAWRRHQATYSWQAAQCRHLLARLGSGSDDGRA